MLFIFDPSFFPPNSDVCVKMSGDGSPSFAFEPLFCFVFFLFSFLFVKTLHALDSYPNVVELNGI